MPHAHPDYTIALAIVGVLLAIGIPALERGQFITGGVCLGLAAVMAGWLIRVLLRSRL